MRKAALVLGVLAFAGCSSPEDPGAPEGYDRLDGGDIESALEGNTFKGGDASGEYFIYFPEDGRMHILYNGQRDSGVWRTRSDLLCQRFEKFAGGNERCVSVRTNGEKMQWSVNNKVTDAGVVVEGNPANLP